MGNKLTKRVQQTPQQPYSQKPLSRNKVIKCGITSLSKDLIQKLADLLSHNDALSLNQTCKLFRECVPHKCLPPSIQVIKVDDCPSLENGKLVLSDVIMLVKIPLKDSTWIDLIQCCCPNLKYLFVIHECKRDYLYLGLDRLLFVEISMKIKIIDMGGLSIHLPSTVENFTAHISRNISRIDPKPFRTISGEPMGVINLRADTLDNLKSL
jgi:hypothetical protein